MTKKTKMTAPERADYFRVFAMALLKDDAYEYLNNERLGMVFRAMLEQWSRRGSLPADPRKLAKILQTTIEDLEAFRLEWPKLQPHPVQPDRVAIPYLVQEWEEVQEFYIEQGIKARLGGDALKAKLAAQAHGPASEGPSGPPTEAPITEENSTEAKLSETKRSEEEQEKQDKNPSGEAPAGSYSPLSSFPPAEAAVSQFAQGNSVPSNSVPSAGPASREETKERFFNVDVAAFLADPGAALVDRWNLMAKLIDSPMVHQHSWHEEHHLQQCFQSLIRADSENLIKLQCSLFHILGNPDLHGKDQTKKDGGFAADLQRMLSKDPDKTFIHEWSHKLLHSTPKEGNQGGVATVFHDGGAWIISLNRKSDLPILGGQGGPRMLTQWTWHYPKKKPVRPERPE